MVGIGRAWLRAGRSVCRDPKATQTAVALGNQSLADRQRPKRARLQFVAQLGEELLHAILLDVLASSGPRAC